MKTYLMFLACCLASFAGVQAEERNDEILFETIEAPRLIVGWSPRGHQLGTLLVYRCGDCEILRLRIDQDTRLTRHGQSLDIATLAKKADWSGHVTISSQAPGRALDIAIFE
ncbi:MAG TPA: hypothetical protein VL129_10065 [Pseudomonas sp.]|jgi:hypothetical protein|uniref:hypothetical protein n=1 Tax=Pseudomonas sp. TaxID=306 RepID=UPI002C4093F0|nr:hypothetical protein [Pseudomonas sp.]HTO19476.1 hypothetical protein [Pseudomonas sp.]